MNLGGPELLIVLVVVLLLFGSAKVPELARGLGRAKAEFEGGVRSGDAAADAPTPRPVRADP